jgi:hypothetical protein
MTPFEYVSVLLSIILGLGITVLLTGVAEIIRNWKNVTLYWPYLVWIPVVFVLHLQEWWVTYSLRSEMEWTLLHFMFISSYPIVLFVLANLLFPRKWSRRGIDLREYYFANSAKFFGSAFVLSFISFMQNYFLLHYSFADQLFQLVMSVGFLILLLTGTRSEVIHKLVAAFFIIILAISFLTRPELFRL